MGSGFSNTDMRRNILAVLLLLVGVTAGRCVRGNIVIRTTFSNGQLVRQETEGAESCEEEDEDHSDESYDEDEDEGDDEDDDDDEEDDDDYDDNDDMEDDDKCECDDVNKSDDRENRHK